MRIEFLTQDDPHHLLPFFDEFLQHYASEFEITQVSCCRAMGNRPRAQLARALLSLYGITGLARLTARAALGRMASLAPRPRDKRQFYSIAQLCKAYRIRYCRIGNPNEERFCREISGRRPDLIVSVACPYILKARLLELPPKGCLNIHHAPLPKYKGMMPTFWQMFQGEKTVGLTVHYMVPRIDEGAILLQEDLEISTGESLDSLIRRSKRRGAHAMARALRQVARDAQTVAARQEIKGSYFTFPSIDQIREFKRRGLRAI